MKGLSHCERKYIKLMRDAVHILLDILYNANITFFNLWASYTNVIHLRCTGMDVLAWNGIR